MQVGTAADLPELPGPPERRRDGARPDAPRELAEPLGYDAVWPPEHHFTDYSACPDNVQFLSWLAGRTTKLKLATGAVIVPWNDPLRVVEKMAFLDHLSGGRAVLGLGPRSRARRVRALRHRDGVVARPLRRGGAHDRRRPREGLRRGQRARSTRRCARRCGRARCASFRDRLYAVGISPESVEAVARLGARLMVFSQQPWEMFAAGTLAAYRSHWARFQQGAPPPPLTGDLMFCHEDAGEAERLALEYMSNYYLSIIRHYELLGHHLEGVKGYELYRDAAQGAARGRRRELGAHLLRHPDLGHARADPREAARAQDTARRLRPRADRPLRRHAGRDVAERSIRLFAERVLPELKRA